MSISIVNSGSPLSVLAPGGLAGPADKAPSAADAAAAKAAATRAANKATLDEIRQKGIYQWAKEQQLAKLEEKLRAEILSARGTSEADLAKLDPKQRASAESSIAEELARRVKEAMLDTLEAHAKPGAEGKSGPAIIDISV